MNIINNQTFVKKHKPCPHDINDPLLPAHLPSFFAFWENPLRKVVV